MALAFDRQIAAFAKKANISIDRAIRGTSIKLFSAIILGWPVGEYDDGRVGGRSRANWQAGGAIPTSGILAIEDKVGTSTVNKMTQFVNGSLNASVFTLSNNMPYAHKIEFGGYPGNGPNTIGGYSKQAPAGVVRINVARFQSILDEQARINR